MGIILTPAELQSTYGGTGTHDPNDVDLAIDLAEFDIAEALNIPLEPTTLTKEYPWPHGNGVLMLEKLKVTSITTVTAKHSLDADCVWTEDAECGVILDGEGGIVRLVGCTLSLGNCNCDLNIIPDRAVVTYVAGFTAAEIDPASSTGKALRMAIALHARDWIAALEEGDFWEGEFAIKSYSSMDYSEQREIIGTLNPLGPSLRASSAWRLLKHLRPYRAVSIRGSGLL